MTHSVQWILAAGLFAAMPSASAADVLYFNCMTNKPPTDAQNSERLFARDFPAVLDFDKMTLVDNYPGWWPGQIFEFKIESVSGSRIHAHLMNTGPERANGSEMVEDLDTASGRFTLAAYSYYLGKKTTENETGVCTRTAAPKS